MPRVRAPISPDKPAYLKSAEPNNKASKIVAINSNSSVALNFSNSIFNTGINNGNARR